MDAIRRKLDAVPSFTVPTATDSDIFFYLLDKYYGLRWT